MKTLREFINIIQEASGTIPNSVDQGNGIVTLGLCGPGSSVNQQNVAALNKFCNTSVRIRPENDYKYAVVDLDNKRFSVVSSEHESGQNSFSIDDWPADEFDSEAESAEVQVSKKLGNDLHAWARMKQQEWASLEAGDTANYDELQDYTGTPEEEAAYAKNPAVLNQMEDYIQNTYGDPF